MLDNEKKVSLITDNSLKEYIIDTLYKKLNLFKYKYQILKNYNENIISNLKKNIFHIILNNFGHKYFAMFLTYQNIKYCFYIEKKKLKYNKCDLNDYSSINIYSAKHCVDISYYDFSLFDGSIIINKNNKKIYIIDDMYYFCNKSYIDYPIKKKLELLELNLLNNYKYNLDFECCSLRVNSIYNKSDLKNIISTTISSCDYLCNGIQYVPNMSGLRYIYIFEKNEMPIHLLYNISRLKLENKINKHKKIHDNKEIINEENNNYSKDFINIYSKSSLHKIKNVKIHENTLNFLVEKTDFPDVYKLYLLENDKYKYVNIAYVPTIIHSMNLVNIFKNESSTSLNLKALYAIDFKKWIPIENADNIDTYEKLDLFN